MPTIFAPMKFWWISIGLVMSVFFVVSAEVKVPVNASNNVLYSEHILGYPASLNTTVFEKALAGYSLLNDSGRPVFVIIDYTKPSTEKRLFVVDVNQKKVLYKLLVAHGKNSGENFATQFSNRRGSLQSSPGFYRTGKTYQGKHGYSLRLYGLEKGINDKAYERAIVMHGAPYVSADFIKKYNRLGRSFGCPAISSKYSKILIDLIKDGAIIYIHTNDGSYFETSIVCK